MSNLSCIANNEIKSKLQQKFALVPLLQSRIQVNGIAGFFNIYSVYFRQHTFPWSVLS